MFEPIRGGTRGGQAEFKWADVSADKDRENYLGHSINAPTGRWQKNKDVHWYNRDLKQAEDERLEEIRKIKEAEADALATPNLTVLEKAERRRQKAERKEEKRAKKEQRRLERDKEYDDRRHRDRSRSRSPRRRTSPERERRDRAGSERKDRDVLDRRHHSPSRRSRSPPPRPDVDYDAIDREKERERDRRRWDANSRREEPGAAWGRR
ncbi:kinase phosphorylation protein-domain-containing protein [Mycena filopes]|nr:kinase phosphorylation protein-domain-containing protein [Mycena filopes]